MKRYTSHKEVDAAKIKAVGELKTDTQTRTLAIEGEVMQVNEDWYQKHSDQGTKDLVGGYFVRYADGYGSWSPAEAFESGYKEITTDGHGALATGLGNLSNGFDWAINMLKRGKKVARKGWNGKDMFLFLVPGSTFQVNRPPLLGIYPEGTEINYHAHIDMKTADGQVVPWLCSQTDALADDWVVVE